MQRGITVIPKSVSKARIEENIKLVTLSDSELDKMNVAHLTVGKLVLSNSIPSMQVEFNGKPSFQGWSYVEYGWEDENGEWLL